MALDAEALLTLNEGKELVTQADTGLVEVLINAVSKDFARSCRRRFVVTAYDERYDGKGQNRLVLRNAPVTTFTELTVGTGPVMLEGYDKEFVVDLQAGIVRLTAGYFPSGVWNIRAKYSAGFATIPNDLKYAAKVAIAFLVNQKTRIGISSITTPEQVTAYIDGKYPKGVLDTLSLYTLRSVA